MTKSSRYLAIVGAVILLLVLWYFFFVRSGAPPPEFESVVSSRKSVPDINFSILEDEALQNFKSWSVVPLPPVPTGRANPFSK